jgi:hypothetical protein
MLRVGIAAVNANERLTLSEKGASLSPVLGIQGNEVAYTLNVKGDAKGKPDRQ